MTTFAPALHLQNDNIHTKIKAQMIIKDPGSSITHFIGMLCAIAGLFPLILKAASDGTTVSVVSYTPVCLIVLHNIYGYVMFGIVWGIAILAIAFKLLWVTCPKWISSVLYIVMGWTCVMALPQIYSALAGAAFFWLLAGGIFYTIGGVIYAIKMPAFNAKHPNFGTHEIFHVFVMAGSLCHFILMYNFVAIM